MLTDLHVYFSFQFQARSGMDGQDSHGPVRRQPSRFAALKKVTERRVFGGSLEHEPQGTRKGTEEGKSFAKSVQPRRSGASVNSDTIVVLTAVIGDTTGGMCSTVT